MLTNISDNLAVVIGESAVDTIKGGDKIGDYQLAEGAVLKTPEAFSKILAEMGDTKPMFMNLAVPSGFSRNITTSDDASKETKNRYWPEKIISGLAKKVHMLGEQGTGLPGNPGHPKNIDDLKTLPSPVVLWVDGADARNVNTGEHAAILRGYVYDVNNYRTYVKTGAFKNGSVLSAAKLNPATMSGEPVMLVEEANFFAVDLVRSGTEGIRGTERLTLEGANVNMEITAEMKLAFGKLSAEQVAELNPKAASDLSKGDAKLSTENAALLDKVTKLTTENAELSVSKAQFSQVAKVLACEEANVVENLAKVIMLKEQAIKLAVEQGIKTVKPEALQKLVKRTMDLTTFNTLDEVKPAMESAIEDGKKLLADLGLTFEMGGISSDVGNESFSIASKSMREKLLSN